MSDPGSTPRFGRLQAWVSLERQAPIIGGVFILLTLWMGEVIQPFALGIPAYGIYFALVEPARRLGLVGIEGSPVLFWVSAVIWLYSVCSALLWVALALRKRVGAAETSRYSE